MQNYHKISLFANDTNAPVKVELHENGQYFVSARELHAFLGSQAQFVNWCERMFQHGFIEKRDYFKVYFDGNNFVNVKEVENLTMNQRSRRGIKTDYWLTFRCAQHIGMVQNTKQGEIIRDYFLDCETRLHQVQALIQESRDTEIQSLRKTFDRVLQVIDDNFAKIASYHEELEERLEKIEANQNKDTGTLHTTVGRVDKIEERLDFKAEAYVYVMYCPRKQWYKLGSSHDAKGRKKDFSTIEPHLIIKFEIPTISREAAYSLENTLKKHFANRHKEGEWYGFVEDDMSYLQALQQSNLSYLLKMS